MTQYELNQREGHVVVSHKVFTEPKTLLKCSCGAEWSVYTPHLGGDPDRITESIRSHHISVGLKPTEVL